MLNNNSRSALFRLGQKISQTEGNRFPGFHKSQLARNRDYLAYAGLSVLIGRISARPSTHP